MDDIVRATRRCEWERRHGQSQISVLHKKTVQGIEQPAGRDLTPIEGQTEISAFSIAVERLSGFGIDPELLLKAQLMDTQSKRRPLRMISPFRLTGECFDQGNAYWT
ncbi:TPA: hypothetical protein L4936_001636 [Pseudomonas aeruginosa]|nr:hypothetical protein [Pseudomonas aeruginosa]HBO7218690.1 hypothetical protein [Pseudomonas aeruginosa]